MENSNIQYDGYDPKWKVRPADDESWKTIGEQVCAVAETIFKDCGAETDYCIQDNSRYGQVVFGAVNRVIWTVAGGFSISRSHCTDEFIEKFPKAKKEMEEYW